MPRFRIAALVAQLSIAVGYFLLTAGADGYGRFFLLYIAMFAETCLMSAQLAAAFARHTEGWAIAIVHALLFGAIVVLLTWVLPGAGWQLVPWLGSNEALVAIGLGLPLIGGGLSLVPRVRPPPLVASVVILSALVPLSIYAVR